LLWRAIYAPGDGQTSRGGQAQLILASAIAIPQLKGSTSAIAIPQLLKKCCSATATPQFRKRNLFLSPQLQSFTSAIFGAFLAVKSYRFMKKKSEVKEFCATVPLRQFFCF
jgi:hypothetical protein